VSIREARQNVRTARAKNPEFLRIAF